MFEVVKATEDDLADVMSVSNEAFLVDSFFKPPQHHIRFPSLSSIESMYNKKDTVILIAKATNDERTVFGSIMLEWEEVSTEQAEQQHCLIGHFSAVSVPDRYGNRGIGKALVKGAEDFILNMAKSRHGRVLMEMGVVNLRRVLFPWYESQGYQFVREIRPNADDFASLIVPDLDVCLILMRKELVSIK